MPSPRGTGTIYGPIPGGRESDDLLVEDASPECDGGLVDLTWAGCSTTFLNFPKLRFLCSELKLPGFRFLCFWHVGGAGNSASALGSSARRSFTFSPAWYRFVNSFRFSWGRSLSLASVPLVIPKNRVPSIITIYLRTSTNFPTKPITNLAFADTNCYITGEHARVWSWVGTTQKGKGKNAACRRRDKRSYKERTPTLLTK
jgi:hypothetical protein